MKLINISGRKVATARLAAPIIALMSLLYSSASIFYISYSPFLGFYTVGGNKILNVLPGTEANVQGIREGDKILSAEDEAGLKTEFPFPSSILKPGSRINLTIEREGVSYEVKIRVTTHPLPVFSIVGLFYLAIILSISYANLSQRPFDRTSFLFYLNSLVTLSLLSAGFYWNITSGSKPLYLILTTLFSLLPSLLLHYSLIFPDRNLLREKKWLLPLIYSPSLMFAVSYLVVEYLMEGVKNSLAMTPYHVSLARITTLALIFSAIYMTVGFISVFRMYIVSNSPEARARAKWFMYGHFILFGFIAAGCIIGLHTPRRFVLGGFQPLFLLAVCFASIPHLFALIRYRLPDVDVLIRSSLLHLFLSIFITILFVSGIGLLRFDVLLLALVLALVYLFEPLKRNLQVYIDQKLYWRRFQLTQTFMDLSRSIPGVLDIKVLSERVIENALPVLGVERLGIIHTSRGMEYYKREKEEGISERELRIPESLSSKLSSGRSPYLSDMKSDVLENDEGKETRDDLATIDSFLIVPIFIEDEMIGALNIGKPVMGRQFNMEDLTLLQNFAQSLASSMKNAIDHTRIIELNIRLEEKIKKVEEQREEIRRLQKRILEENIYLKGELGKEWSFEHIIGSSKQIKDALETVMRVAGSESSVLILGETGTGKELIARAIHENSSRNLKPFVKVNCTAIPETLLESELFGYERGAFTGAIRRKLGRFDAANGGTIFLDEIGDMPLSIQVKLLRVLQEKEFEPLGSTKTTKVDARVIAATNRNLEKLIGSGQFREDLYYRLNVIRIEVPPLRERLEDILDLSIHFLKKQAQKVGKRMIGIEDDALQVFKNYMWPGNVRELENAIERAIVLAEGEKLSAKDFSFLKTVANGLDKDIAIVDGTYSEIEKKLLTEALSKSEGNKSKAARILGLKRSTFLNKLRRYGAEIDQD